MIRLVTQFDQPSARAAAATPTCGCGCCCSCCCCIVTLIGASTYTAVSAQGVLRRAKELSPERVKWTSPWPGVLGVLALPVTLLVAIFTWWTVVIPFVVWLVLVGLAYRGAGARRPWAGAAVVVALGSVALVAEFVIWAAILL